jgi:hypothetical protein
VDNHLDYEGARDAGMALQTAAQLPDQSVLCMQFAHFWLHNPLVIQAISDLRDLYKDDSHRMLVVLGPRVKLPPELQRDFVILDEPLPGAEQLASIIDEVLSGTEVTVDSETAHLTDALRGLAAFEAEQALAMAIDTTARTIRRADLWERKRAQVEQTDGLSFFRSDRSFSDIGGVENAKQFLTQLFSGNPSPTSVILLDEIGDALAGVKGDTSGTSQDAQKALLTYMNDYKVMGLLFVGVAGCAKSFLAQCCGAEFQVPVIALDLGACKGSLVGQSEQKIREALKVITAVSGGNRLFIGTTNSTDTITPQMLRRFKLGKFYFALPDEQEAAKIWPICQQRYGVRETDERPAGQYTGAEIDTICELSSRLGCTFTEASSYVVPVATSRAEEILAMDRAAHGRFTAASYPGPYRGAVQKVATLHTGRRKITA